MFIINDENTKKLTLNRTTPQHLHCRERSSSKLWSNELGVNIKYYDGLKK